MPMDVIITLYLFGAGAALGSFALVLADRMHVGTDWVKGRSMCDHCGHKLHVRDLIPLFSWIVQAGKCRYCRKKISVFYPLVELGLGLSFAASYMFVPYVLSDTNTVLFVLWLTSLVLMAALVVTDLKWFLLLNKLVYPLIFAAFVHRIIEFSTSDQSAHAALLEGVAALIVGSGLFWTLNKLSHGKWIGDGDYRLGAAIALFLGDPVLTWISLFFASVLGLLVSFPTLLKSRNRMRIRIPFGPFLIGGLFITYLTGDDIVNWYSNTFLYL